ncbi:MAG: prephenate dehydrogenase/arogenate dehydrogenase family protein [Gemmatimonadales bacterium]
MRPNSLAVLGLGAIGGSLAWQARRAGVPSVIGYAPDRADCVQALRAGAVHDIAESALRAVSGADFVVLAAAPGAILDFLPTLAGALAPGAISTDVASIKQPIIRAALDAGLGTRFAGSHPFAGTHVAGWGGARPDRFTGATVYVCPTGAEGEAVAREVMNFWSDVLGAHTVLVDAVVHDRQLAWTSHLPQAVASALARTLAREPSLRGASLGTGARDTTRLAASPAGMWADVLLLNRDAVAEALERMSGELEELRRLVQAADRRGLESFLEEGGAFRRRLDPS